MVMFGTLIPTIFTKVSSFKFLSFVKILFLKGPYFEKFRLILTKSFSNLPNFFLFALHYFLYIIFPKIIMALVIIL